MDKMIDSAGHLTIPNDGSITEIGEKEYFDAWEVKSATISDAVKTLGKGCFAESDLESVELGNGIAEIPEYAFDGSKLKQLVIPGTVKKIADEAFARCELESVALEEGVETLGEYSFFNNVRLKR